MYPRISGGTRADTFNSEFRARLSLIIWSSKALMESMLASQSMLMPASRQCYEKSRSAPTYADTNACS